MSRVAILGLDSAVPSFIFGRWKHELPHLSGLIDRGAFGLLRSTHPPITVPAWTAMTSSRDPGQLGIYGFRNRKDYSYDGYRFATSSLVEPPRLWDLIGSAGKRSVVLGVPQTYPPRPLNGEMVSCFLTPNNRSKYTYPESLRAEVEKVTDGYSFDVEDFRTPDKAGLLERCYAKTRKHHALVCHMLKTRDWDFFMSVEMGIDRMHHGFWSFMDEGHRGYRAGNRFEDAIREYYHYVDRCIGEIVALLPSDTVVMVVSDHGARRMEGGVCFNEWLIQQGFLVLKTQPTGPTPISRASIDWHATRAWGDGGYYARCFLNVRGREPNGTVDPGDYEKVRDELVAGIEALEDHQGRPLGSRAYRPEEIFREVRGVAPDLIVYFGDLAWRSVGSVGMGSLYTFENDTGPDEANHDWHGTLILSPMGDARLGVSGDLGERMIYDVAPTVLNILGIETPSEMIGRPLQ